MNSTIHRRKIATQSSAMSQNNKEHRIHNRENNTQRRKLLLENLQQRLVNIDAGVKVVDKRGIKKTGWEFLDWIDVALKQG
jgi:uncharacterized protein